MSQFGPQHVHPSLHIDDERLAETFHELSDRLQDN